MWAYVIVAIPEQVHVIVAEGQFLLDGLLEPLNFACCCGLVDS